MNGALVVAAFTWIYFFGESLQVIELVKHRLALIRVDPTASDPYRLGASVTIVAAGAIIGAVTYAVMFGSLFLGRGRFRTTRMWLILIAITCGWLGLAMSWPAVYWYGQQRRVSSLVTGAETLVQSLNSHWPTVDGELPDIGPFLAYPIDAPSMLMPLAGAEFPGTGQRISAVERSGDKVMRFQLAGDETGAWLEWRGDGSAPQPFVGGLETQFEVERAERLAPNWFLVRYRSGLALPGFLTRPT